jgi:hypothetical protein
MPAYKVKVIGHDSFARFDVIRKRTAGVCRECGWTARVYQFGTHSDQYGATRQWFKGEYCSLSCCNSYNRTDLKTGF